jgi:type I restriction enzyme S subunit
MSWPLRKLGEFISIKHGWAFKGEFFSDAGKYILLTPGNANETGGLKLRPGKEKFYLGEFPSEYLMKAGDMLVVMTDLIQSAPILGGAIVVPEDDRFLHNQRLGLVEFLPESPIDKVFLYYLLNAPSYRAQVRGSATGATVRHTAPKRICDCNVLVPDTLAEQRQVAEALSAYDDLIATNQRRIALHEDAARRLYREWFVHLRFPGNESVAVEDGVPEGWAKMPLGDLAQLSYGKALKASERQDGEVPVYGSSGIVGAHNKALIESGAIIVGRKGNVGSLYFSPVPCFPIDTVFFIAPEQASYWLYLALHQFNFVSSDAAVPGLNRNYAHGLQIVWPDADTRKAFELQAGAIFEQIQNLTLWNAELAKARDLLLPKLMSGQLDVSGIALPEAVAA